MARKQEPKGYVKPSKKLQRVKLKEPTIRLDEIPREVQKRGITPLDWAALAPWARRIIEGVLANDPRSKRRAVQYGFAWKRYRPGNPYSLFGRKQDKQEAYDRMVKERRHGS